MLNPERKSLLNKYTKAVKAIVYDANRMRQLAPMLDTRDGSIKAVMSILGAIEQTKPIPPDIKTLLGINTYILMVDLLQEIHGQKPDNQAVSQTILALVKTLSQKAQVQPQQPIQLQPAQRPAGLINGAMA
jgi:hypothetical protein